MKRRALLVIPLLLILMGFGGCPKVDKVVGTLDAIIAAATVDSIIQSNNPLVVQLDSSIIDDASKTIDLWTQQPHTSALIGQIAAIWTDLLKTVKPEIEPIANAIVQAINRFLAQIQAAAPAPAPAAKARTATPKLSPQDNAKVTEMREQLRLAKAKLAGNPALKR